MTQPEALPIDFDTHPYGPDEPVSQGKLAKVLATMRQFATLSELLRILGAATMVGAMSVFLMQGWLEGNDLQRYFKLLAQTLLLTAGGFGLSYLLKEHKGARLFFGLSLVSVAANFTILGALIYSVVQFDGMLGRYPDFATWISNDPLRVFMTSVGAIALLIPVTMLAYSVLARRSARWLTGLYLVSSSFLLIPIRSSVLSSLLAIAVVGACLYVLKKQDTGDETLATFEGRFAKLTLFLPPVILFVRSWYFYHLDALAVAAMSGAAFLLIRHLVLRPETGAKMRGALDIASLPLAILTAAQLTEGLDNIFANKFLLPIFALACAPMFADLVLRSRNTTRSHFFGVLGAMLMSFAVALNELFYHGFVPAALAMTVCASIVMFGYWLKRRWIAYIGVFSLACITLGNLADFLRWFNFNNWILLSVLGASSIVLASLLDRYGAALKLRLDTLRQRHQLRSL